MRNCSKTNWAVDKFRPTVLPMFRILGGPARPSRAAWDSMDESLITWYTMAGCANWLAFLSFSWWVIRHTRVFGCGEAVRMSCCVVEHQRDLHSVKPSILIHKSIKAPATISISRRGVCIHKFHSSAHPQVLHPSNVQAISTRFIRKLRRRNPIRNTNKGRLRSMSKTRWVKHHYHPVAYDTSTTLHTFRDQKFLLRLFLGSPSFINDKLKPSINLSSSSPTRPFTQSKLRIQEHQISKAKRLESSKTRSSPSTYILKLYSSIHESWNKDDEMCNPITNPFAGKPREYFVQKGRFMFHTAIRWLTDS